MTPPLPDAGPDRVPFTLSLPASDTFDIDGLASTTTRVDGTVTLTDDGLRVEWRLHVRVEQVTLGSVDVDDSTSAPLWRTIPVDRVRAASLGGTWWAPRLVVQVHDPDVIAGLPGVARPSDTFGVRIARDDRPSARALVAALAQRLARAE